jgi:urease subunit gamma/beta
MIPGEYLLAPEPLEANPHQTPLRLLVANTADRPIQVGSHFHFFEANRALHFDREAAYGRRLAILSGTAVRFEPGEEKWVELIELRGNRQVYGMNGLVSGSLDAPGAREAALERARRQGYLGS